MRIAVDYDLCESNAICMGVAPHIFQLEADDSLSVLVDHVPGGDLAVLGEAMRRCPKQAISLVEDPPGSH